jgi:anti-sigma factor RsiW
VKPPRCTSPIDPNVLADYWLGELPQAEESRIEEHLLGCESCSRELQTIVQTADGIRSLARQGALRVVLTREFLDRLATEGLRVRQYSPAAGGGVQCTITPDDDLLVGHLAADVSAAQQLDVVLCDASGREQRRLLDVPFNPARPDIFLNEPAAAARLMPATTLIMKLVAVDERGERVLGQYTFNHTPYTAGP